MEINRGVFIVILIVVLSAGLGSAGDIVHQDKDTPQRPGCANNFVLVFLQNP